MQEEVAQNVCQTYLIKVKYIMKTASIVYMYDRLTYEKHYNFNIYNLINQFQRALGLIYYLKVLPKHNAQDISNQ